MSRRIGQSLAAVVLSVGGGIALSACTSQTTSLAHQACVDVNASLKLFSESQHATGTQRAALESRANVKLREALPNAALAASGSTDYQALEATLSESSRVPEVELTQALSAQCDGV